MSAPFRSTALKSAQEVKSQTFLDALVGMSQDGRDQIRGFMSCKNVPSWDGLKVVPPGSFLEEAVELFRHHTDIPLELPLIGVLSHVSGFLNTSGARYSLGGSVHSPRIWTVALAPSGSGKSFAMSTIARWLSDDDEQPVVPHLAGAASAAQFVANIEQCPRGLWFRDEFGQFLSQVQNLQYMEQIKDVLLRMYSGDPIEWKTRGGQIEIRDHALTILGVTVGDTFEKQIGAESLVDGFAQRFNFIRAEADPARPMSNFPIYFETMEAPEDKAAFDRLRQGWLQTVSRDDLPGAVFDFDANALQLFKDNFQSLFKTGEVPPSFFRRAMFSAFSYAVVFHVIAGRPGTLIGTESVSLGLRMVALHLDHARQLLNNYGLSDLEKVVRKVEALQATFVAQKRELKPRDVISRVRDIQTAAQARSILALIKGD